MTCEAQMTPEGLMTAKPNDVRSTNDNRMTAAGIMTRVAQMTTNDGRRPNDFYNERIKELKIKNESWSLPVIILMGE